MLKVYMTGLVYIHGCTANTPMALLPDGTNEGDDHHASLWVDKDKVDLTSSSWPQEFYDEHDLDVKEGRGPKQPVKVCEFRIPPGGTTISFPATPGTPQCGKLDADLARLTVDTPAGPVPFVANPAAPDIIATVPIGGGIVTPYKFNNIGIIEWSISSLDSWQISASAVPNPYTIVLKNVAPAAAEIVLSNLHHLDKIQKPGMDTHHYLYKKLNPSITDKLIEPKQPGHTAELSGFTSAFLKFLKKSVGGRGLADGETPTCCS